MKTMFGGGFGSANVGATKPPAMARAKRPRGRGIADSLGCVTGCNLLCDGHEADSSQVHEDSLERRGRPDREPLLAGVETQFADLGLPEVLPAVGRLDAAGHGLDPGLDREGISGVGLRTSPVDPDLVL